MTRRGTAPLAAPANSLAITSYGAIGGIMGLSGSFLNVAGRMTGLQNAVALGLLARERGATVRHHLSARALDVDGAALAQQIGYSAEELAALPDGANMGLSCGNPKPAPPSPTVPCARLSRI